MATPSTPPTGGLHKARLRIAQWLIGGSILLLAILAGILIWVDDKKGANTAFTMLVPLLGTWVGTVLAYYFSGENFDRASQSMQDMVAQVTDVRLRAVQATTEMIDKKAMVYVELEDGDDGAKVNLQKGVLDRLSERITRLPVLRHDGLAQYIVHNSLLYEFVTKSASSPTPFDPAKTTLKDFLDYGDTRKVVRETMAFVPKGATLADAKKAMDKVPDCQDVFVTEDGTRDTAVLGWLTNTRIARSAEG